MDAILSAAEEVFAQQGHGAARMEDIAARAGIATGTLYNYFDDRHALLVALAESRGNEMLAMIDAALHAARHAPVPEQLLALYRAKLEFVDRRRNYIQVLLQNEMPLAKGSTPFSPCMEEMKARFKKVLAAGVRDGLFEKDEHGIVMGLLFGAFRGAVILALRERREGPLVDLAPLLVEHFLHGAAR